MTDKLGPATAGCRQRLAAHYGYAVSAWLDLVPGLLTETAQRWSLKLGRYHDAGHSSALVVARTDAGTSVMLKAWFDRERYANETAALRHWDAVNGAKVLAQDDNAAVACLELVGGIPGGRPRPLDDERQVAIALSALQRHPRPTTRFPCLEDYLAAEVEPRVRRRVRSLGSNLPRRCVDSGLRGPVQCERAGPSVLLHADLYQENVPWGDVGPVFLDPLPMFGDVAFDWAFFIVYYDLARDPVARLSLAVEAGGVPAAVLRPWCLMMCLDGLLYYHAISDVRERRMIEVMDALSAGSSDLLFG